MEDICLSVVVPVPAPFTKMPTPESFTNMPRLEPSATEPAPEPSENMLTPKPSTKKPTAVQKQESPCVGETNKKRCTKAPLCSWDISRSTCVLRVASFPTPKTSHLLAVKQQAAAFSTLKPSANAPMLPTMEAASSQCKGMSKKQCTKDANCHWNTDQGCVKSNARCGKMYHPRNAMDRTCSNDNNYPKIFSSMKSKYFFPSSDACCLAFYSDGRCNVENVCPTGTQPLTATTALNCRKKKKWHPLTASDLICTNSDGYPALWDTSAYSAHYLSSSAKECCQKFYSGGTCRIVDVCS